MEQENVENRIERRSPRIVSGLFLVVIGVLLLAYKMGAPIPNWIFTWPVLLMVVGFFIGIKSRFRNPGALILLLIGTIFFIDQQLPGVQLHNYILPIILISLGILFMLRPRKYVCEKSDRHWERMNMKYNRRNMRNEWKRENFSGEENAADKTASGNSEYLDINAVFGGIKKNIQSKNFKGGEVVSFMGGCELNFMHADILEPVELEINNVFAGTKLIIPSDWHLKNQISAVFGGVEDKRNFTNSNPGSTKQLTLTGSCVFGGIEIANY